MSSNRHHHDWVTDTETMWVRLNVIKEHCRTCGRTRTRVIV